MAFERQAFQLMVTSAGTTVDLVPNIAANAKLVISRIRAVVVTPDPVQIYIFRIPTSSLTESEANALVYELPLGTGQAYDEPNIILNGDEGIAVGIQGGGPGPKVVFSAFGELETP